MPQSFIARPVDRPKIVKGGISTGPPLLEVELMDSLLIILLSGPERIVQVYQYRLVHFGL